MAETFLILLPQVALACLACVLLIGGTFKVPAQTWSWAALGSLAIAAVCMFGRPAYSPAPALTSPVTHDLLSTGFQWCILVAAALFVLASMNYAAESDSAAEFYALLLIAVAGTMLVSVANDLVLLLLALELISVPTYVLLYLGRRDYASQEAATKYFLLSVMSAAILLYGFAFLYGLTGTTNLKYAHLVLAESYAPVGEVRGGGSVFGVLALVLIFAGLGFKLAAVPFHFYAPDVYQGTSAFNAGLLSVVPKAAGLIALIRVLNETMTGFEEAGERTALILAIITMTGGNCLALLQTNVRRMLAYSGIAHAGYMLIGIAVGFWDQTQPELSLNNHSSLPGGVHASLLYLLVYSVASVGMFSVLIYLARKGKQIEHREELTGLIRTQPVMAVAAAIFLFSMAGIPPLAGFWGTFALFNTALSVHGPGKDIALMTHGGFTTLAIIAVLNAAVAIVYYLRLVLIMFLNEPISHPKPEGGRGAFAAAVISSALVVAIGIAPGPVFDFLRGPPPAVPTAQVALPAQPQ